MQTIQSYLGLLTTIHTKNMTTNKKLLLPVFLAIAMIGGTAASYAGLASAQSASGDTPATITGTVSATAQPGQGFARAILGKRPDVMGEITAINGNTITVTSKDPRNQSATPITYTTDLTNATIKKRTGSAAPTTVSIASLTVGDHVGITGTITGTSVIATEVISGMPHGGRGGPGTHGMGMHGKKPGVHGTVVSVSGNTITLSDKDGKTYTVDATNATVSKMTTSTVSQIAVGDTLGVQGTVSGTTVTATDIMNGMPPRMNGGPLLRHMQGQ
jgi:hypothetical protein